MITVVSIMGGPDIVVPEGVEVELGGFALLGGNDLKVGGRASPDRERPSSACARSRRWAGPTSRRRRRGAPAIIRGCSFAWPTRMSGTPPCGCAPTCRFRTPTSPAHNGEWVLELDAPPWRGSSTSSRSSIATATTERVLDPGNPHRAPGAFGEKSVLLLPGYAPPAWLDARRVEGRPRSSRSAGAGSARRSHVRVWSPADAGPGEPLPLLVAHDGPEYDRLAGLTHFAGAMIAAGALPPHRVALLAPGERDEWYSASARYARALCGDVVPALRAAVAVDGAVVGMGASLGALAMLHAQRRASRHVRRAVPAVGQLLHAALRLAGVRLPALPADRALRARTLRARRTPRPGAGGAHLRHRGGERRSTTG